MSEDSQRDYRASQIAAEAERRLSDMDRSGFHEGSGTCENVWAESGKFKCSECAMEVNAISTNTTTPRPIAFCPNCGKAVKRC